jgi:hypothetical protein
MPVDCDPSDPMACDPVAVPVPPIPALPLVAMPADPAPPPPMPALAPPPPPAEPPPAPPPAPPAANAAPTGAAAIVMARAKAVIARFILIDPSSDAAHPGGDEASTPRQPGWVAGFGTGITRIRPPFGCRRHAHSAEGIRTKPPIETKVSADSVTEISQGTAGQPVGNDAGDIPRQ